jgi:anti-anti-sigma factor
MELQVSHESGYVLARTLGPIDESAEKTFREQLFSLVGETGKKLVLDLSQSKQISSQGIGQLVALVAYANSHSNRVILAACSPFISVVLSRCKLDKFFEISATVAEAVQAIGG